MSLSRRYAAVLLPAAAFVALVGSVAHAVWSDGGAGSGSAATANMQTVTVMASTGDNPSSTLYPGGTADVVLRVNNPNAFSVKIVAVTAAAGSITPDAAHAAGCTTTGVSFTNQTGLAVTAATGQSVVHLPGAATMNTTSSSGCQGATFSIPVTLEARTS